MLIAVEGVYREGRIELNRVPDGISDDTPVIVTFLLANAFDEAHAADLRARLSSFTADWDSPEMAIYDNYDAHRAKLSTEEYRKLLNQKTLSEFFLDSPLAGSELDLTREPQ